ncbi:excinuclease ABC subunit UvrC, partial [Chloroflexota bacterium]
AIILEYNLIQRHQPHYNVRLKDGKTFPFLKITLNEEWPRVNLTRYMEDDGGRYFGPFASAKSLRQTLKVLKGIFPFRSCSRTITGADKRPCLNYYIHLCAGPCIGAVNRQEYTNIIRQVILFLEGKQERIVRSLENRMEKASESLDFEKAAVIRDQIQSIERVIEGQKITARVKGEQDVIAFVTEGDRAYVQVFFIRSGKLIGRDSFILQGTSSEEPEKIMTGFLKQFYGSASYIPPLLLVQHPIEDKPVIESWLQSKRGSSVSIQIPHRGNKKQLVDIVAENAEQGLRQLKIKQPDSSGKTLTEALNEIKEKLRLPQTPLRMECYDISNIQGKAAVGSMVVFDKGKPKPAHYRRFKINTVTGADDYAMLQEVLRRRFKRFNQQNDDTSSQGTWAIQPDLILIDGGKGQLNSALEAMKETGADSIPVAGLAKENEELFIPGQKNPIILPATSPGLQLLQRLRDEAHRFAISYHQRLRRRQAFKSPLDSIPGIGPRRKRALIKQFGSAKVIREASIEELTATEGITRELAKKIKEHLDITPSPLPPFPF